MASGSKRSVGGLGCVAVLAALWGAGVEPVSAQPRGLAQPSPSAMTSAVPSAQATLAPASRPGLVAVAAPVLVTPPAAGSAPAPVAAPRRLRRVRQAELSDALVQASSELIKRHYGKKVGTEIEVEVEGKSYVARIERHFHPEGGERKPWGFHPGVSLFTVR